MAAILSDLRGTLLNLFRIGRGSAALQLNNNAGSLEVKDTTGTIDAPLKAGGITNTGRQILTPSSTQSLTETSVIQPNAALVRITSTAAIRLTSTPEIAPGNEGQKLVIINVGSFTITSNFLGLDIPTGYSFEVTYLTATGWIFLPYSLYNHKHAAADITSGILATARGGLGINTSATPAKQVLLTTAAGVWTPTSVALAWTPASLTNGWTNFSASYMSAQYMLDPFGNVFFCGSITGGVSSTTLAVTTLPVGMRPLAIIRQTIYSNSAAVPVVLQISANGNVFITYPSPAATTSLFSFYLTFKAEQ